MNGPNILAHSLSIATSGTPSGRPFQFGNRWQYHPRSDRHSKIACWAIVFDLIQESQLLRSHLTSHKIAIGINHPMRDFSQNRVKNLDLVVCRTSTTNPTRTRRFSDLVERYTIALDQNDRAVLAGFPEIPIAKPSSVLVALEAKACMTEFIKARPRLYDELNSSHLTIHSDTDSAIAVGFAMINIANRFISPLRNPWPLAEHLAVVNNHRQPQDARSVVQKLLELPRRSMQGSRGFDAIGIAVVNCPNDGQPVSYVDEPIEPAAIGFGYNELVVRLAHIYETRFTGI